MKKSFTLNSIALLLGLMWQQTASAQPGLVLAKNMGGTNTDRGYSIAVDASGNVYTTGYFAGTADFNPDPAISYTLTSAGGYDIFVSKLNSSGNFVWAKTMGGTSGDYGLDIVVGASGNVYTTGFFGGTADFNPDPAISYTLTSAGGDDIFVSKLDASGAFVWAKNMGGVSGDIAYSIALDGSGNVYTTGIFQSTADFNPDPAISYTLTSAGLEDIFVSKLNSSGNFVWVKNMGGTSLDYCKSIALDASGNIYTTGYFDGTADFDPDPAISYTLTSAGGTDIFVSKLDASGTFVWAKRMGGTSADYCQSIALDGAGNVYTTGYFQGTVDFDPGAGTSNLVSAGGYDIFVSELDASGNFLCAGSMGGTSTDVGLSIALDGSGNAYTTGFFGGTADFDPCTGISNLTSAGSDDIFVAKYTGCNCGIVLPIELLSFTATAEENGDDRKVRCNWSTASETSNDYFAIQRSVDGVNFEQVGTVQGTGNSTATLHYVFYDEHPFLGLSYYRLKQVDYNRQYSYSNIEAVYFGGVEIVNLYPNPANSLINIETSAKTPFEINIMNVYGEIILKQQTVGSQYTIDVSKFESGIYFIQAVSQGKTYNHKIIITH